MMTRDQMLSNLRDLESAISKDCREFEVETGLRVQGITVSHYMTGSARARIEYVGIRINVGLLAEITLPGGA